MINTIFFEDKNNFNRALSEEEKKVFTNINPDTSHPYFPQANVERIKYLAKGGEYITQKSSVCKSFECMPSHIDAFNKTTGDFITSVDWKLKEVVCTHSEITCTYTKIYVTYNCIGWAIGVTKWVQPSDITDYINRGGNTIEAINSFLADKSKLFNLSVANKLKIVEKLSALENYDHNPPINNTVAFYFNDKNEFLHGARYVETILDNITINSWTSKLGMSFLVSHGSDDLKGEYSLYGNNIAYAIVAEIKDELAGEVSYKEEL